MIYDIIGIGIGPFNLGLAALTDEIPELNCLFIDSKENFDWHPGLMIPGARMQVPFYADLVTLVNPRSKYSYFNFLHDKQRMIRFGVHENNFPTRKEYNAYCKWVVSQLETLQFNKTCTNIFYSKQKECYGVQIKDNSTKCYWTKHIVIGTGTVPSIPECANNIEHPLLFHSSNYLDKKQELLQQDSITIMGSGQSAAEIFNDLMDHIKPATKLKWFTRSDSFSPMDYSKFALEKSSPDYINYFYQLTGEQKIKTLSRQNNLYKGINFSLISQVYDKLYDRSLDADINQFGLFTNSELINITREENFTLQFRHTETHTNFTHNTDAVILATGYKNIIPDFLKGIHELVRWNEGNFYDVQKDYAVSANDKTIFVQNADLYSHGFNAADLGLGPYRNAVILNSILKKEYFRVEPGKTFQQFGTG